METESETRSEAQTLLDFLQQKLCGAVPRALRPWPVYPRRLWRLILTRLLPVSRPPSKARRRLPPLPLGGELPGCPNADEALGLSRRH